MIKLIKPQSLDFPAVVKSTNMSEKLAQASVWSLNICYFIHS